MMIICDDDDDHNDHHQQQQQQQHHHNRHQAALRAVTGDARPTPHPPKLEEFFFMGNRRGVGGRGEIGNSLENLHAMVEGVSHDDAPVAVDGDAATRVAEFSVA